MSYKSPLQRWKKTSIATIAWWTALPLPVSNTLAARQSSLPAESYAPMPLLGLGHRKTLAKSQRIQCIYLLSFKQWAAYNLEISHLKVQIIGISVTRCISLVEPTLPVLLTCLIDGVIVKELPLEVDLDQKANTSRSWAGTWLPQTWSRPLNTNHKISHGFFMARFPVHPPDSPKLSPFPNPKKSKILDLKNPKYLPLQVLLRDRYTVISHILWVRILPSLKTAQASFMCKWHDACSSNKVCTKSEIPTQL